MNNPSFETQHLEEYALRLVLDNLKEVSYDVSKFDKPRSHHARHSHFESSTIEYSHPLICSTSACNFTQESTSTLIAAVALMKANRTTAAWSALRSLFSQQGYNGFLPKYVFSQPVTNFTELGYFCENTEIPTSRLFKESLPPHYKPCPPLVDGASGDSSITCLDFYSEYTYANELQFKGSGRLAALPLHSTAILEIFYLSNQTSSDVEILGDFFNRLYKLHYYWMEHVMKRCSSGQIEMCYNIINPWESMTSLESPQWNDILQQVKELIGESGWTPKSGLIPENVRKSNRFPEDPKVFDAVLYLIECHSNVTALNSTGDVIGDYELQLISYCPFAMLDLSHLSILSRSTHDLQQIAKILRASHSNPPTKDKSKLINAWIEKSDGLMHRYLWDETHKRYSSRNIHFVTNGTASIESKPALFRSQESRFVKSLASTNLMAGWSNIPDTSHFMESIISPILAHDGSYNFNCNSPYPLTSWACDDTNDNSGTNQTILIDPLINYYVSLGLIHNGEQGVGGFIQQETLKLMCSDHDNDAVCTNLSFANSFAYPLYSNNWTQCDLRSTTSAALLYDLLTPDKSHRYIPTPPMKNSWVIVLVVAEIVVAFSVGLSCLLLSLNLMKKLAEEEHADRLAREQNQRSLVDDEEVVNMLEREGGQYEPLHNFQQEGDIGSHLPNTMLWNILQYMNPFKINEGSNDETG